MATAARRALLCFSKHSSALQDGFDCAELLTAAGHADAASALLHVMSLEIGGTVEAAVACADERGAQRETARPDGTPAGSSIEIAIAQIRRVHALADDLDMLPLNRQDITEMGSASQRIDLSRNDARPIPSPEELTTLCERLAAAFRRPFDLHSRDELRSVLAHLSTDVLGPTDLNVLRYVGAELPLLGSLVATQRLRRFLVKVSDLADAPFGSIALAHAAASLDWMGLGPLFVNTTNVIRGPHDVFALIQLALGARSGGGLDEDVLERWVFLLSLNMPNAALRGMVDEMADHGLTRAIAGITERVARRPETNISLLWCIRDAGLDLGDYGLAVRAQRLVIERDASRANEWILLGRLEATAGDHRAAEGAFIHGLELDPGDVGGKDNLAALRRGSIDEFQVLSGFGSPDHRKLVRAKRRPKQALS